MLAWLLLAIFVSRCASQTELTERGETYYCLSRDSEPNELFGDLTPYEVAKSKKIRESIPKCTPYALWAIGNTAINFPDASELNKLNGLYGVRNLIMGTSNETRRNELCPLDLELIKNWLFNRNGYLTGTVSEKGKVEASDLGGTYASNLKTFSDLDQLQVGSDGKVNSMITSDEFVKGLEKRHFSGSVNREILPLLAPEVACERWEASQTRNEIESERQAFLESDEVKKMLGEVSQRLGFSYNLKFDLVYDMYTMCRYDNLGNEHNEQTAWCAAFVDKHIEVLQYYEDMLSWLKSGYGNQLSEELACPIVQDFINKFQNIIDNGTVPRVTTYFANATVVRAVLTRLGIAKDKLPLTSNNMNDLKDREWKTSLLTPFLGNVVAELYKCTEDDEFQMMFYVNGNVVQYSGCKVGLCSWKFVHERFRQIVESPSCSLDFCKAASSSDVLKFWSMFLLIPLFVLMK